MSINSTWNTNATELKSGKDIAVYLNDASQLIYSLVITLDREYGELLSDDAKGESQNDINEKEVGMKILLYQISNAIDAISYALTTVSPNLSSYKTKVDSIISDLGGM